MAEFTDTDVPTVVAEQSALRRVATLVARNPTGPEVFESVTRESAKVLGAQVSSLVRFEDSMAATTVGGWSAPGYSHPPVPRRIPLDGDTAVPTVSRTGAPARLRDVKGLPGDVADMLRELGIRSAVAAPIKVDGRNWGAIVLSATEPDGFSDRDEGRLCDFAELVAQAISNAEARVQLAESRARLVEASDSARRRLERNLHDGAQQWFVALSVTLRRASELVESDPEDAALLLAHGREQLATGLSELRELARGLHPAELSEHGLGTAIEALAVRMPMPVELDLALEERLPGSGGVGGLLPHRRGADQRGQVRRSLEGDGSAEARRRRGSRGGARRRRRWRRPGERVRPARPRRSRRGPRWPPGWTAHPAPELASRRACR